MGLVQLLTHRRGGLIDVFGVELPAQLVPAM
jgi:hypothetical protein